MNEKMIHALMKSVETLETVCEKIIEESKEFGTVEIAKQGVSIIRDSKDMLEEYMVDEGIDASARMSPDSEIFRSPLYPKNTFTSRPTFIIGNRRSGTTLLSYLLNASKNICALPETFLAGEFANMERLLNTGYQSMASLNEPQAQFLVKIGQLLDNLYIKFALNESKIRWVSKELFTARKLDLLDAMFDYRAQYIYIVRHGFNVAYSCSSRFPARDGLPPYASTGLNLETYLDEWIINNQLTMDFYERNSSRCHLIQYEDLTSNPQKVGRDLFKFLDETWTDEIINSMEKQKHREAMGDNKIFSRGMEIKHSPDVWHHWPRSLKVILARKANHTLVRLGYKMIDLDTP